MHGPNPGLLVSFIELLTRLNKRNHRKFCIIDERTAFIGSMNIWDVHLESRHGPDAWRDTGARIQGDEVINLLTAFNIVWFTKRQKLLYFLRSRGRRMLFPESSLVRLNSTRKLRRKNYLGLISRIRSAKHRLWITNSYFVPHGALLRALGRASARNVDVRIIVPSRSDVIFMPWVTASFYQGLLKKGVRIFEYQKSVLHAKSIIIDDWTILGSSNLNYRSLFHDLEADVLLTSAESCEAMRRTFEGDLARSAEVTLDNLKRRSLLTRVLGRFMLAFKHLL